MDARTERVALILLFLTPALWSVNYWVARAAPGVIGPHALAFGRWLVAASVLLAFCGREVAAKRVALAKEWPQLLALSVFGMWICGAWVYIGARSTTAINIGLIYAASPVLIALLSWVWLKERFAWSQAAGVCLALAGLLHIVLQGQWLRLGALQLNPGDLWIAACALAWAAYALLMKRWPSVFSPMARLALTALAGCVVMLVPTGLEAALWIEPVWSLQAIGLVVFSALLPGAAAFFAYGYAQKHLGAARVASALYLGPLYAAALGVVVLGESLHSFHWVGAALILPGIALASRRVAPA
jgi:drug/metabolite transporter (DMT)-like permease